MEQRQPESSRRFPSDGGFTLVEVLIVIIVLGVLATVVVAAVGGITDRSQEAACAADNKTLATAIEAYRAEFAVTPIPAADATPDGSEITLVNAGFLREVSKYHDIDAFGDLILAADAKC